MNTRCLVSLATHLVSNARHLAKSATPLVSSARHRVSPATCLVSFARHCVTITRPLVKSAQDDAVQKRDKVNKKYNTADIFHYISDKNELHHSKRVIQLCI